MLLIVAGCNTQVVGPQGPPGNANVTAVTISFHFDDAIYNGRVASQQYSMPEITLSVVDNGAVLLYFRDQGTWTALPFTLGVEADDTPGADYTFTIGYAYDDSFLEVFVETSSASDAVWDDIVALLPPTYVMKAVIIDGFAASVMRDVDVKDLPSVLTYFGLED